MMLFFLFYLSGLDNSHWILFGFVFVVVSLNTTQQTRIGNTVYVYSVSNIQFTIDSFCTSNTHRHTEYMLWNEWWKLRMRERERINTLDICMQSVAFLSSSLHLSLQHQPFCLFVLSPWYMCAQDTSHFDSIFLLFISILFYSVFIKCSIVVIKKRTLNFE